MDIKPIRTEQDYQAVLTEIEGMMDAQPGTEEFDRLDVLATLVSAYEAKYYPIPLPDPISAIEYAMQSRGWSRKQLEEILNCSSGRISEILNRKRSLTIGMIRKLHEKLGISLEILIRDYALQEHEEELPAQTAVA